MAITAETRTDIIELVVGMFDAAPGATVLSELAVAVDSGLSLKDLAITLGNTDVFKAEYPVFLTSEEFATKYLTSFLGGNPGVVSADNFALAVEAVVALLNAGKSRGEVVYDVVTAVSAVAETDANFGPAAALLNNQTEVATYYSVDIQQSGATLDELKSVIENVTTDDATVATAKENLVDSGTVGSTFTLTTSATDVVSGTSDNDTIIGQLGQSVTLQASDTVNGNTGTDTLRVVTDGAAAQSAGGFTTNSVEVLEVQAQANGGSTLSLENAVGVNTIRSSSSNGALTLNQVRAIADLEVKGALGSQALTINYQSAAVAGASDVQNVALDGNALGALTVNGVETLALTTAIASSSIASVVGSKFATVTVAGDKSVSITGALPTTVKTVDASKQTAGGTTVTAGVADVTVTGGAGSDSATFTGSFTSADSFDGGEGRDTIVANMAEYTGSSYAAAAKISNVETIRIADKLTADFDASKIAGEDTYRLDSGFTGPVTISKADDASSLDVRAASTGTLTYSIGTTGSLATDAGTANTLNISVGGSTDGVNAGTIAAAGVETLTLNSRGINKVADSTKTGVNTLTISDAAATSLTVTGSEDLTLTMTGTALTTLDASASSGENDFSAVTYKATGGATITGGSGIDKINGSGAGDTIVGGTGADIISGLGGGDTLTGGDGADTFAYNAKTDSQGTAQDTITDFVSGTDKFNFTQLAQTTGRTSVVLKSGNAADFGSAQAAIALNSGTTQVVYQADTNTLWVDLNDDGTLNNNDLSIKLTGVTKVAAADVGGTATPGGTGNFITLSAAAATVNATTSTNADAFTTKFDDTINSKIAQLAGTTIDGLAGTDKIVLSDAGAVGAIPATITNVETLNLATVGTTANTGVAFNNAGIFANVNGSTNADTIASTADLRGGGKISLGAGDDTITALTILETAADADTSYDIDVDMGDGDDNVTLTTAVALTDETMLAGGAGADTLTLGANATFNNGTATTAATKSASISGFETLANGGNTVTLSTSQYAGFTTAVTGAGAITFSDSAAVVDKAASTATTYQLNAAGQSITGNAAVNYAITGGAGNDTFILKAGFTAAGEAFDGAGGTGDTFNIAYDVAGAIDTNGTATTLANVENMVISVAQSADYTLTPDAALITLDASAGGTAGKITTLATTNAAMTSVKLGAGNDVITAVVANTANQTIELGAGNDTITDLATGAGTMKIAPGAGTFTITDISAVGAGVVTFEFAAPASGTTTAASVAATTANIPVGTIFDFASDVTSVVTGAANGTLGVAGANGQVFVDSATNAANTIITFDADGSRTFSAGDIQITVVGNVLTGGIDSGNFVIGASA